MTMCSILPRAEWLPESAAAGIAGGPSREWAGACLFFGGIYNEGPIFLPKWGVSTLFFFAPSWASSNIFESVVTVYDSTLIQNPSNFGCQ